MNNYKIQKLDKNQTKENVITFLDNVLPYNFKKEGFDWQYGHKDSIFYTIIDDNNKVLGTNGIIYFNFNFKDKNLLCGKSETSYLDNSIQGKGLFKELYIEMLNDAKKNNYHLIWGFTSLGEVWRKLGFLTQNDFLFEINILLNNKLKFQKEIFKSDSFFKSGIRFLINFSRIIKLKSKLKRFNFKSNGKIFQKSNVNHKDDIPDLFKKIKLSQSNLININFDTDYFENNLDLNPYIKFDKRFYYDEDNILIGFAIININNFIVEIYDITAIDKKMMSYIMNIIILEFKSNQNFYSIKFFGNYKNFLIKQVFDEMEEYNGKIIKSDMFIVYKKMNDFQNENIFQNFENWYINSLWTECVQR